MKKVDGRKNNGGARKGAGAPKKEVSEKAREIMKKAIRVLYNRENDEEAQIAFLKDFAQTTRGQQFVAEHLFGKAPQVIEQEITDKTFDLSKVSTETLKKLEEEMNAK